MAERIQYRKLPGHRRGFIRGSSVWVGPDHLLAVNSLRFREEYKRYYFRDIQAITIAKRPRFHLSTRAAGIGYFWLIAFAIFYRVPHGAVTVGATGIALVVAWAYVSALCSCRCRIHTAVSQDRLPSVYRTWVARKFVDAVEPQISAIQGRMEGPLSDWEAVRVGPRAIITERVPGPASEPSIAPHRSFSFGLLLAILMTNAVLSALVIQQVIGKSSLVSNGTALLEVTAAILVLVHHHRRRISGAQQKLAIATLIAVGLFFYGTMFSMAIVAGASAAARQAVDTTAITRVSTQLDFITALVLSAVGLGILLFERRAPQEQGSIIS